ncbi:LysM domain receptor-like kinase 4 [Linum perenne]
MSVLWFLMFLCSIICFNSSSSAQQHYYSKDCADKSSFPGSRYTCNRTSSSCETFVIFRANQHFKTLETVSNLLQVQQINGSLQNLNRIASNTQVLEPGREIFVPVKCSCSGHYSQTDFSYRALEDTSVADVACSVFESLVTYHTIMDENGLGSDHVSAGTKLHVPLKCACPSSSGEESMFKFLATYPVFEGDMLSEISEKFGVSSEDLFRVNGLQDWQTIFPNTTLLIPLKSFVLMNVTHTPPPPPPPQPPTIMVERSPSSSNVSFKSVYIAASVVGFFLVVAAMFAFGMYVNGKRKDKVQKLLSFNTKSSQLTCGSSATGLSSATPCVSPDLLVGIIYSLRSYNIEELRTATNDFSKENKVGDDAYKGMIDGVETMVKPLRFEDIRQVIDVHSRINHINIVTLVGVCYGDNNDIMSSCSYILLELPSHGCLRNCISNPASPIRWHVRTQIAFDIAAGLHYLHDCIFPSYAHMCVNTRNVFVTSNWRAKLTNIRTNSVNVVGGGWLAPEYNGLASEKVDIFAFGVVLLELISGREDSDGKSFKESLGFLGGGAGEGGCFEQLRSFIDPRLNGDYPLAEALCLAVLAKTCVEDDPCHRPSMDDILKVLVRMV